jgi:lipopolysaccharide/colanic/teichoic acid biosynthesis glycosyltransferase
LVTTDVITARDSQATTAGTVAASADSRRHTRVLRLRPMIKRTIDITVATAVLLLTLPIFLVVAVAIVVESPGPVFYRAERVGRGRCLMRMFKFRKMLSDAGGLRLTTGNDPRLTRVGAILTRSKLDELPQFLNVLRGEMSLVGPRPEDPGFVERRADDYDEILTVRPGITGPSQIAFADESRILSEENPLEQYLERIFPQKIAIDRAYARHASLLTDLRILYWTAVAVMLRLPVAVHRESGAMNLRRRKSWARARVSAAPAWLEPQTAMASNEAGGLGPSGSRGVSADRGGGHEKTGSVGVGSVTT